MRELCTCAMEGEHLELMVQEFPEAPLEELRRFARARQSLEEARNMYQRYRRWRSGDGNPDRLLELALAVTDPLFVTIGGSDEHGDAIVMVEGARCDTSLDPEAYCGLICSRLDDALAPDSPRRLIVLIDVRAGTGWPNPPASRFLPLVRKLASCLAENYPERLRNVIVYPLPSLVRFLANCVLVLLDKVTRDKVIVVGQAYSSASVKATDSEVVDRHTLLCPADELKRFVALDMLPDHVHHRHAGL